MRIFCIACPELPERRRVAEIHFKANNLDVDFVNGIHGETFGILCYHPYRLDRPHAGELIYISQVGLTLSHYMVWQMCEHMPGDHFLILEDDAKFCFGAMEQIERAMKDLPADWDIFLVGSCNTSDKPKRQINGQIYVVEYPFCTHAYIVRKTALPVLLRECRDCSAKIDILLTQKAYPKLNVFTLLPRAVVQRGTELSE